MDEELNGQIVPEKYFLRFYFKLSKCLKYLNQLKPKQEEEEQEEEQEEQEERNVILGKHFDVYLFLFIYFIHNHKFSISYFNS